MTHQKFINEIYKNIPNEEQLILKDIINDIINLCNLISPEKKSIHQIKNPDLFEKASNIISDEIKKEWLEDDFKEFIDALINTKLNSRVLIFPIYKNQKFSYNINKNYNSLYVLRKDFLNILTNYGIIQFIDFKSLWINNFDDLSKWNTQMKELINKSIERNIADYWEEMIKNDLTILNQSHYRFWIIRLKKDVILELNEWIKETDNDTLHFSNGALIFQWKVVYNIKKNTNRERFLDLFFSKEKNTNMTFKEIINYLEAPAPAELTHKNTKRIYDLKDDLNKIIADHTKLVKFFELGKWVDIETIYRKY